MTAVMEVVGQAELFAGLPNKHFPVLEAIAQEVHLSAGESLFKLGDPARSIFVVRTGRVELTMPVSSTTGEFDVVIAELSEGQVLGWSILVPPYRLTTGARAKTQADLIEFPRPALADICESIPELGRQLMTNLVAVVSQRLQVTRALWQREFEQGLASAPPQYRTNNQAAPEAAASNSEQVG